MVNIPTILLDEASKSAGVEFRHGNTALTGTHEDKGGCAAGNTAFASGVHYWEVKIESMWDANVSDGSLRVGVSLGRCSFTNYELALGDEMATLGWWDNIVDGLTYKEFLMNSTTTTTGSERVVMKVGQVLGLLLDLESMSITFFIDKKRVGSVTKLPQGTYYPAFYTRTHLDRLCIVSEPVVPKPSVSS